MSTVKPKGPRVRPLGAMVPQCIGPALARHGFGEADIITCWPDIVGPFVARSAEPLRLHWPRRPPKADPQAPRETATLILRVDGGFAVDLQHMAPTIVQRINDHLGWRCVGRLAFRQAPLQGRPPPRPPKAPPDPRLVEIARGATEGIADERLRAALMRLGLGVLGKRRR